MADIHDSQYFTEIERSLKVAELKIDSDRVKKAAAECPDAARVLKTLFPDVFVVDDGIVEPLVPSLMIDYKNQSSAIQVRNSTNKKYHNRTLYLTKNLNWKIEDDADGYVLVARKKEARY
jgi:hypothetical protein